MEDPYCSCEAMAHPMEDPYCSCKAMAHLEVNLVELGQALLRRARVDAVGDDQQEVEHRRPADREPPEEEVRLALHLSHLVGYQRRPDQPVLPACLRLRKGGDNGHGKAATKVAERR